MPLGDLFKSKEELAAEQKKQQRRELRDATRACDRIQSDLDRQAKDLESQIKAAAKKNDTELAKTLAKQLIKVRNEKVRATGAKSKISNISSHASSMEANNKLAQVMANSASALSKVNQQMQPEQLANQMSQFQAENTKMEMKDDAFNEMFDELFEGESDEADSIMDQVLSEIAIDTSNALIKAPSTSSQAKIAAGQASGVKPTTTKATEHHHWLSFNFNLDLNKAEEMDHLMCSVGTLNKTRISFVGQKSVLSHIMCIVQQA